MRYRDKPEFRLFDMVYELDERVDHVERQIKHLWRALIDRTTPQRITGFDVLENNMPFAAGATAVIDFTPVPAGAVPAAGDVPALTSSDPVNAPVTADATGLVATVVFAAAAPAGDYTITCSYTNPDGVVATPGTFTGSIAAPPPPDITGFTSVLAS